MQVGSLLVLSTGYLFDSLPTFSLRYRLFFGMAPVQQLEVTWPVVCAACCHMALVCAVVHL